MLKVSRVAVPFALALAAHACAGLSDEQEGRLAALKFGDVSNPKAPREDVLASLEAACGPGGLTAAAAGRVARAPYVQRTTPGGARLVWTAPGSPEDGAKLAAEAEVRLSRPDGSPAGVFPATVDASARPEGAVQLGATLEALEPGSVYCYVVARGGEALTRPTGFRTAPSREEGALAPGSSEGGKAPKPPERVRFTAFGDCGDGSARQRALFAQARGVPADFWVLTGDIAYDSGTRSEFERNFFAVYAPVLGSVPVFPAVGNHEYRTENAAPFREAFDLPSNGGEAGLERYYSFDWGGVHFTALDTERIDAAQAAWLEADLATSKARWKVVYGHEPPYSSGEHGSSEAFRRAFGPAIARHGVALVLSGHDHHYERTSPIDGTLYVVTGGGGRELREVAPEPFTAFADSVIHFVHVEVEGSTLRLHAIDGTGTEFDSAVIVRP